MVARGQHVDVLVGSRAVLGAENTEVADVPDSVANDRGRNNVPNLDRDVDHAADRSGLSNPVELPVVRVHGVQSVLVRRHAVPRAIGLEVREIRVSHRIGRLEGAEVRQHRPGRARPNLDHAVRDRGHAVRAARSG